MTIFRIILVLLAFVSTTSAGHASENKLPVTVTYQSVIYQQCGTSELKAWKFIHVGFAGYYKQDCDLANSVPEIAEILLFDYDRDIEAKAFRESATEMLKSNLSNTLFRKTESVRDSFHQNYVSVKEGDRYMLVKVNNTLTLLHNNVPLTKADDESFANSYFTIWLGDDPFDERVKRELLDK